MITCIHLIRKLQDSTGSLQSNQLAAMNCTLVLGKDAQNGDWISVYVEALDLVPNLGKQAVFSSL